MTQDSALEQQQGWCGDLEPHGPHKYTLTENLFALGDCAGREPTRSQQKRIAVMNQQDAGEEEWTREPTRGALGYLIVAEDKAIGICPSAEVADQIVADHAAARRARKLEERVRELETALRIIAAPGVAMAHYRQTHQGNRDLARALLSPATGKEK